jgi:hypothetical protein
VFTTIRQYRCHPDDAREIAHLADEHFADRLAEMEGFVAYELLDCGGGDVFTLTVFVDRDSSLRSNHLAAEFVNQHLDDMSVSRTATHTGVVLVNRAQSDMMEMVHA